MKRFAAITMALVMILSVCALAESSEAFTIGTYTVIPNGFTWTEVDETEIDLIFDAENAMGVLQYMSYESLDITYADFELLGLDQYAIADMFIASFESEGMLATVEKENLDFVDGVSGIRYNGLMTAEYNGVNYSGVLLVDQNAILSFICIGNDSSVTPEVLESAMDTFLINLVVVEAAPAAIGDLLGSSEPAETILGEGAVLGAHTLYAPVEWELAGSSDGQLVYSCGDNLITLGTYDLGDASTMESVLAMDYTTLASTLETSTVSGLSAAGLDASTFTLTTLSYTDGRPIIHFEGDASAIMNGYYITGATLITDVDMAMIMIFSTTDTAETIDGYLWQAIDMFFN